MPASSSRPDTSSASEAATPSVRGTSVTAHANRRRERAHATAAAATTPAEASQTRGGRATTRAAIAAVATRLPRSARSDRTARAARPGRGVDVQQQRRVVRTSAVAAASVHELPGAGTIDCSSGFSRFPNGGRTGCDEADRRRAGEDCRKGRPRPPHRVPAQRSIALAGVRPAAGRHRRARRHFAFRR